MILMNRLEQRRYEKSKYFCNGIDYAVNKFSNSNTYQIWKFIVALRREEYFRNKIKTSTIYIPFLLYARRRKNILGRRLGFDIPAGVLGVGVRIFHPGNIVINPYAFVGEDCRIVGNLCIGNQHGEDNAPHIGKNCLLGWGCTIIGESNIGDDCKIGAGSLVINLRCENNSIVIGSPAHVVKN